MRRYLMAAVAIGILVVLGWSAEQPVEVLPAATWEQTISNPEFTHQTFMVPVKGAMIEAMILLPSNTQSPSPAIVFFPGSGHSLYQNYAPGFLETHLQDIFLPRGIAVVYMNKRGMGASTGNWMNASIEGFAEDMHVVVQTVRALPQIDATRVGVAGHSQGGWVAVRAAATDPELAFALNLMGPLRAPSGHFEYMWHQRYNCSGYGQTRARLAYLWKAGSTTIASWISHILPVGQFEFDRKFFAYETTGLLADVRMPLLSVYGLSDNLVDGPANAAFLSSDFPAGVPSHIEITILENVNHRGYLRDDICDETSGIRSEEAAPEVRTTIENWLSGIGL